MPKAYFESQDPTAGYLPERFAGEGFIHCTDGEFMISVKANQYFGKLSDELFVLFVDRDRVKSRVRYDDPAQMFPHIYGPLNREAIVKISRMARDRKGDWIFPFGELIRT